MDVVLAYFDPGAGSLMLQVLLGGAGGIVVLCRYAWSQLLLRRPAHRETLAAQGK